MTYESIALQTSRYPINIVHLDLANPANPDGDYFCDYLAPFGGYHPCIEKIDTSPAKLAVMGVGTFANVTITFKNFAYGENGTFFGKLLANNPYFLDRPLHLYEGFHDPSYGFFSFANCKKRTFFIRSIKGPDEKGRVIINAVSVLINLSSDEAIAPPPTAGVLPSELPAGYTGYVGVGDATNFETFGYVLIDNKEICFYYRIPLVNVSINITERGVLGTTALTHAGGSSVVFIRAWSNAHPFDVIYNLILRYTKIDVFTQIDIDQWNAEKDTYLPLATVSAAILKPTKVIDLIEEICANFFISLYEDDTTQKLQIIKPGRRVTSPVTLSTERNLIWDGLKLDRDLSKAITKTFLYWGKRSLIADDDPSNYSGVQITANATAELEYGFSKSKDYYLNWVGDNSESQAVELGINITGVFKFGETIVSFKLDIRDAQYITIGTHVRLTNYLDEDIDGNAETKTYLIIEKSKINDITYSYKALDVGFGNGRYAVIAPDELAGLQYADATEEQRNTYIFIANDSGLMSDGSEGYTIL